MIEVKMIKNKILTDDCFEYNSIMVKIYPLDCF